MQTLTILGVYITYLHILTYFYPELSKNKIACEDCLAFRRCRVPPYVCGPFRVFMQRKRLRLRIA
jgi:hypothetical protein